MLYDSLNLLAGAEYDWGNPGGVNSVAKPVFAHQKPHKQRLPESFQKLPPETIEQQSTALAPNPDSRHHPIPGRQTLDTWITRTIIYVGQILAQIG